MKKGARWYWGGTALGALLVVVLFITANDAWGMPDIVGTMIEGWFLFWVIIHLAVAAMWMLLHLFDGDDNDRHSGGSSSGIEWGRLGSWYLRGRLRNQMRKASR